MNLTPEIQKAAGEIADEIEKHGHYQGRGCGDTRCLILSETRESLEQGEWESLRNIILDAAGVEGDRVFIGDWNDAVDTDEVLDVLRAIEIG